MEQTQVRSKFLILLALSAFSVLGCTKKENQESRISLQFPKMPNAVSSAQLQTSSGTSWGLADPTSLSQIKCFGIFVGGPDPLLSGSSCKNASSVEVARFGPRAGLFAPGASVEIYVPSGPARKIYLLGFALADGYTCETFFNGTDPTFARYSAPFIIGQTTADLNPGDNTVNLVAVNSFTAANKVGECTFFTPPTSGSVAISGVTPSTGPTTGSTSITITGAGFATGATVSVGGSACTSVNVVSSTSITCVTPAHTSGTVSVAVTSGGSVGTLASGFTFQTATFSIAQLSVGQGYTCARSTLGKVKCWGQAAYGRLGSGAAVHVGDDTGEMGNWLPAISLGTGRTATHIAAGDNFSCAIRDNNSVVCWGANSIGQLGIGSTGANVGDSSGQMGDSLVPISLAAATAGATPTQLALGGNHGCVLMNTGEVLCWGSNTLGQIGDGTTTNRTSPVLVSAISTSGAKIAAGGNSTCVITNAGQLKCWGSNSTGQLGDGTTTDKNTPTLVSSPMGSGVTDVSLGGRSGFSSFTTCAVKASAVYCWGSGTSGQIGDGSSVDRLTPTLASTLSTGMTQVTSSTYHSCALNTSGGIKCWGDNSSARLGLEITTPAYVITPTSIVSITAASGTIGVGDTFSCALIGDRAKCWGHAYEGRLGNQTATPNLGDTAGQMAAIPFIDLGSP